MYYSTAPKTDHQFSFSWLQLSHRLVFPFAENLDAAKGFPLKPGVGRSTGLHACTAVKDAVFPASALSVH